MGCPSKSSASTQPADHTSEENRKSIQNQAHRPPGDLAIMWSPARSAVPIRPEPTHMLALSSLGCYNADDCRRLTYAGGVVSGTKDELGGSIVARADVGDIRLPADQLLGTANAFRRII